MTKKEMDDSSSEAVASLEEVEAAIQAMSVADLERLQKYAGWRLRRIGPVAGGGLDPMDLVVEALEKARGGVRQWKAGKVDLVGLLAGIIKSVTSHRAAQAKRQPPPRTGVEITGAGESEPISVLEQAPAADASPEEQVLAREEEDRRRAVVEQLEAEFAEDETVQLIMEGWKDGMKGPEIREWLGLSQKEYETATRRLRRKARSAVAPKGGRDGRA